MSFRSPLLGGFLHPRWPITRTYLFQGCFSCERTRPPAFQLTHESVQLEVGHRVMLLKNIRVRITVCSCKIRPAFFVSHPYLPTKDRNETQPSYLALPKNLMKN